MEGWCARASGVTFLCAAAIVAAHAEEPVERTWLDRVTEDIRSSEYRFSLQDGAWSAPNRAHDLRSAIAEDGLRLTSRTRGEEEWSLFLTLVGVGREGALAAPQRVSAWCEAARTELRSERVTEWFVNDERGLEHGFTIHAADGVPGELVLELALGGTLLGYPTEDGRSVLFKDARGAARLVYRDLVVLDARGRELPARLELAPGVLRVRIDDGGAVFPVTVDPLMTSPVWVGDGGGQLEAHYGSVVATAGDVDGNGCSDIIVGVPLFDSGEADEGRAFVYLGSPGGLAMAPVWTADGNQEGAHFGASVGTAGDVDGDGRAEIVVGAPDYDNDQLDAGRVRAYKGTGTGPAAGAYWVLEGTQARMQLGAAVGTAGDVDGDGKSDVILGAPGYDAPVYEDAGRVYLYLGSGAGLSSSPAWFRDGATSHVSFGAAVGTAGDVNGDGLSDVIVVERVDPGNLFRYGVYLGDAGGLENAVVWSFQSVGYGASQAAPTAGTAGDIDGDGRSDVIVVGQEQTQPNQSVCVVRVFRGADEGPEETAAWTAEACTGSTAGDVNGDGYADVIVGLGAFGNEAWVYLGSSTGLAAEPTWTIQGSSGEALGAAVATAGDVNGDGYSDVIVGAPGHDGAEDDEGRAYVYLGSAAGPASTPGGDHWGTHPLGRAGLSVASAGDVNGDGHSDVIVGAPGFDNGQVGEGQVYVYAGSADGLAGTPLWSHDSDQAYANFGRSVSAAGDVNGDGYSDIIIGADFYDSGQTDEGRVFVYHSTGTGFAGVSQWSAQGDQASAYFGRAVASAGDVNGDGVGDVIIGAPYYDDRLTDEGLVFVYLGSSPSGLAPDPVFTYRGNQASAYFGSAVGTAGDVNRDGRSDIVVGAPYFNNGETNEGQVFVFRGAAGGVALTPVWLAEGNQASALFGTSAGTAGDVNGDGYSDLVVGAPNYDNGQANEGRAYLYLGSSSGLVQPAAWSDEADQAGALFGTSVGTAGDVNGDGYSDVIVGASHFDRNVTNEGRAYVYFGSMTGLGADFGWSAMGGHAGAHFGAAVASAGDVNGDGYADVLVGSPDHDSFGTAAGRASLFYGNEGPGVSMAPRQGRVNIGLPIAALGKADGSRVRLRMLGRSPFGRSRVRLEREVVTLTSLLDGLGTSQTEAYDTGVDGKPFNVITGDLPVETPHKWKLRLLYDPSITPFAPRSRWLSPSWNGAQEWDLRTGPQNPVISAGAIPDDEPWPPPLLIDKEINGSTKVKLSWSSSCVETDTDYAIYEGRLGDFTSHVPMFCSTGGMTEMTFTPYAGDVYFLVVPRNASYEGSYGTDSRGNQRRPSLEACTAQAVATCE